MFVVDVRNAPGSCMMVGGRRDASRPKWESQGEVGVPAGVVRATVRVTVVGAGGRADLVVPLGAEVGSLSRAYAEAVGAGSPPPLATVAGVPLADHLVVDEAPLSDGDVVLARDQAPGDHVDASDVPVPPAARGGSRSRVLAVVLAASSGLAGAAVLALSDAAGPARAVCLLVLLLCAVVGAVPLEAPRGGVVAARARATASPVFGAAAGFAATYRDVPGGLLLALAVAALSATVFAAVTRMFLDSDHDELAQVWLVVGGAVAVLVTVFLLTGASAHGVWTVTFAAAVVAARLLPYTVVDVPDRALLDLDRLAVTAWSARERPRGGRRRAVVRFDGVDHLVKRGQTLVAAGTVMIAVLAGVTGPLLLLAGADDLAGTCSQVMVGLGAVGLSLVARSFRATLPRLALRLCSWWLLAALGLAVVGAAGSTTEWGVFAGVAVLALVVTLTAVQLGRGWRSVWWARAADLVEGLAIVLMVALVPLASGLSEAIRGFVS
jgi:hypothetical protein